jgi:hypothetical protein
VYNVVQTLVVTILHTHTKVVVVSSFSLGQKWAHHFHFANDGGI